MSKYDTVKKAARDHRLCIFEILVYGGDMNTFGVEYSSATPRARCIVVLSDSSNPMILEKCICRQHFFLLGVVHESMKAYQTLSS